MVAVFDSLVTFQVHGSIFPQKNESSTGKVCPTSHFGKRTPENKGRNEGHPLEKRRFSPRIAKDGLSRRHFYKIIDDKIMKTFFLLGC